MDIIIIIMMCIFFTSKLKELQELVLESLVKPIIIEYTSIKTIE